MNNRIMHIPRLLKAAHNKSKERQSEKRTKVKKKELDPQTKRA